MGCPKNPAATHLYLFNSMYGFDVLRAILVLYLQFRVVEKRSTSYNTPISKWKIQEKFSLDNVNFLTSSTMMLCVLPFHRQIVKPM